ncbi:MAG: DegQ family serine endoprotease [Magnetospirillum sp.]|nr:DegQ family serine endoprotease [Magnetospirillum sp.]
MLRLRILAALAILALTAVTPLPAGAESAVPGSREQIKLSFAPIVRQTAPAVVNIYTRRVVKAAASPLLADPFFRQFFGDMMPPGIMQDRVQRSLGSGVIVSADGTVVTNHHVIRDADAITVVLADHREYGARVVGSDDRADLAVLKIDPKGEALPTLPLGDSDALEVGDLVIAIGDPFGVGQTVTSGIVSALARTNVGLSDYRSFIQTDAAINPGNSGGALVDMDGRLVGINTAIYSRNGGGSIGIGFAIPSSLVKAVLSDLAHGGKVVHPWMGASGQPVTPDIAQQLKLPRPVGVLLSQVSKDGPAAKAGLTAGDVIVAVNGREVEDPESLRFRIATLPMGGDAHLTVIRDGAERTIDVHPVPPPEIPPRDTTDIKGDNPLSGATLANLNPALADEVGMNAETGGVVVLRVGRASIAQRLQFRPGDIILRINDRPVASVADAKLAIDRGAGSWRVMLSRQGQTMTLMING